MVPYTWGRRVTFERHEMGGWIREDGHTADIDLRTEARMTFQGSGTSLLAQYTTPVMVTFVGLFPDADRYASDRE